MATHAKVLVGYATAAGSTAGIAGRIAARLTDAGHHVRCAVVGPEVDPTGYDAVVVGSAVHSMAWLPPALDLLGRAVTAGVRPVWCFSVGGVVPDGPLTRWMATMEAQRVARAFPAGFMPRDHRVFGGVVDMSGLPLWGRLFWRAVGGRPGDHRDWAAVDAWARTIAADLAARPATAAPDQG